MENTTSPMFESLKEEENSDSLPYAQSLTSEEYLLLSDELSDNQDILVIKESNLVEEEMMTPEMGNIFEDDTLSLPSEDSLYHLNEYFTLRTINPSKKHY